MHCRFFFLVFGFAPNHRKFCANVFSIRTQCTHTHTRRHTKNVSMTLFSSGHGDTQTDPFVHIAGSTANDEIGKVVRDHNKKTLRTAKYAEINISK